MSQEESFEADGGARPPRPPPLQAERTTACRSQLLPSLLQHHPRSPSILLAGLSSSWLAEEREGVDLLLGRGRGRGRDGSGRAEIETRRERHWIQLKKEPLAARLALVERRTVMGT